MNITSKKLRLDLVKIQRGRNRTNDIGVSTIAGAYALLICQRHPELATESWQEKQIKECIEDKSIVNLLREHISPFWDEYVRLLNLYTEDNVLDFFAQEVTTRSFFPNRRPVSATTVHKLVEQILDFQAGDSVLDLRCGLGEFLHDVWFALWNATGSDKDLKVVGIEQDAQIATIAKIWADANGIAPEIITDEFFGLRKYSYRFDKVFCFIPPGLRIDGWEMEIDKFAVENFPACPARSHVRADWAVIMRAAGAIKEGGKAVVTVLPTALSGVPGLQMRQYFVEQGMVEAVITLPPGLLLPATKIPVSLLVLSNGNREIKFIDAAKCTSISDGTEQCNCELQSAHIKEIVSAYRNVRKNDITNTLSILDVLRNKVSLNAAQYVTESISFENSARLGNVTQIIRGAAVNPATLGGEGHNTGIRLLTSGAIIDGSINKDEMTEVNDINAASCPVNPECALRKGDLVISRIGPPFKIAVVGDHEGEQWYAGDNVFICRPNAAMVDPYYLAAFFASGIGSSILGRNATGITVRSLSAQTLENIAIPVPSLTDQADCANEMRSLLESIANYRSALRDATAKVTTLFKCP